MKSLARPAVRASLVFLAMLTLVAIFADLIASDSPLVASGAAGIEVLPGVQRALTPTQPEWAVWAPVRANPLATNAPNAMAVLAGTVHGARSVVLITLAVLAISLVLGLAGGALAGYGPPVADALLARVVELTGALPTLVVLAVVRAIEHVPSIVSFVLVVAVLRGVRIARLVRGEMLRVSAEDYVVAARALGAPGWRVAGRHVLPHVAGPVLVAVAFTAAGVVALEAGMSFVGLGLPADVPSWGALLGRARELGAPALVPATAIVVTTAACWLVADALDDALAARRGRALGVAAGGARSK